MPQAKPLFELQQTDLDIEEAQASLQQVEARLGEDEDLLKARAQLQADEEHLERVRVEQRSLEWETDELVARVKTEAEKLYSGRVGNPKELASLQQEIESLQDRKREKEDRLLEVMEEAEEVQSAVKLKREQLQQMQDKWQEEQQQLAGEKTALEDRLSAIKERRREIAASVEGEVLNLYIALRKSKGRAVVRIELGRCQGCRLTLSVAELQQARTREIMQCNSCGRILYMG
jgi:predicted  nucleic acid-binding Zn-ribbon protein